MRHHNGRIVEMQASRVAMDAQCGIEDVEKLINEDVFLRDCVLDAQIDDGTLVILTDHTVPRPFVRERLKSVWDGPVESYCASGIMRGSGIEVG